MSYLIEEIMYEDIQDALLYEAEFWLSVPGELKSSRDNRMTKLFVEWGYMTDYGWSEDGNSWAALFIREAIKE
jgi:hypothetical protein